MQTYRNNTENCLSVDIFIKLFFLVQYKKLTCFWKCTIELFPSKTTTKSCKLGALSNTSVIIFAAVSLWLAIPSKVALCSVIPTFFLNKKGNMFVTAQIISYTHHAIPHFFHDWFECLWLCCKTCCMGLNFMQLGLKEK